MRYAVPERVRSGRFGLVFFGAATCAWMAPATAEAQLRRDAAVQPVGEIRRGDLLLGVGSDRAANARFPLAGWRGDLWSLGRIRLAYAPGDRAVFEIRGPVRQILLVEERLTEASVPLDPATADGTTSDSGDFELSLSFLPLGGAHGLGLGGHVAVKLPNTDETLGIGPNTTDVTIAALGSWGADRWRFTGYAGVGILEAPLRSFEQNDVFAYALEGLFRAGGRLRLGLGLRGRASTRGRVPLGTEDLGELNASGEWRSGRASVDVGLGYGFAGNSADWTLRAGIAWHLARAAGAGHPQPDAARRP